MITLNSCPVCHNRQISQYPQFGTAPWVSYEVMPGVKIDAGIISRYFICQNCHVIFQNPRMSDEELGKFYSDGYYRQVINTADEQKEEGYKTYWAKFHSKIIKENLSEINSHLDIGCGKGYLLNEVGAKLRVGIEPDIDYVAVSGIKVYASLKELPQKSFDLVTAIQILEHVSDPMGYLKDIVKLADRDGRVVIEVPSWKSPNGPLRLPHLFHFEPDVLRWMCREVGLNVIETKFTPHLLLICKLNQNIIQKMTTIINSCPNCHRLQITEYRTISNGIRYCQCQDCKLIFQNSRLSDEELDKYYKSGVYHRTVYQFPEGRDATEENRAKIDAEIIKEHIGKVVAHLDNGCGRGFLLDKVGANLKVGVESDIRFVNIKGVETYAQIDQVPQKSFDLVSALHLLEHVPYPLDFLKKMTGFVEKNGHLVIEVPSWKTRGGPFGFWHLYHFEPDVLKNMCKQAGLSVIHEQFTPHLLLICKHAD